MILQNEANKHLMFNRLIMRVSLGSPPPRGSGLRLHSFALGLGHVRPLPARTSREQPCEPLDKYSIEYMLYEPNMPLSYLLDHSSQWQVIYADSVAKVYRRVSGGSDRAVQGSM